MGTAAALGLLAGQPLAMASGTAEAQEVGVQLLSARSEALFDPLGGTLQLSFSGRERLAVRLAYTFLQGNERTLVSPLCPDPILCLSVVPWSARTVARVHQVAATTPLTLVSGDRLAFRMVAGFHLDLLRMESRSRFEEARWQHQQMMWGGALGVEAQFSPREGMPLDLTASATRGGLRAIGEGDADARHYSTLPLTRLGMGVSWRPGVGG